VFINFNSKALLGEEFLLQKIIFLILSVDVVLVR
jgi:hypothetical protein